VEDLLKAVWVKLSTDATLITMTGYTTTTKTIKRANTTTDIKFSTTISKAVTFQEWTDVRTSKTSTGNMHDITYMFVCWSNKNDLECIQLKDYLLTLLNGVDLTNSDIKNYYSEYDDFCTPAYYDKEELAWRIDCRFRFKVVLK